MVVATGAAACLGGAAATVLLPMAAGLRWAAAATWHAYSLLELARLVRAYRMVAWLAVAADRRVVLTLRDGDLVAARLMPGSLILRRLAWLRLKPDGGREYGELLCGNSRKNKHWRRLQVIRRHVGAAN